MRKKLLSILLTLALLLSLIPASYAADIEIVDEPVGADAPGGPLDEIVIDDTVEAGSLDVPLAEGNVVASGQCGDNLYWTLDDQGTLTITGTGDMWSSPGGINWDGHKNDIISVVIEDGATSIGIEAFRKCTNLTSAVIPGSVVYIDTQAFDSCSSLSSVTLSEGLQEIGMYVFYNCSSLTSIRLPESVSNLALCSFASCTALREVQLSSRLTNIPIGCFGGCSSLTGVEIPDGVTSIGSQAFADCASLTKVILPDGVTSIGSQAFADCSSVTKLVIPASVSEIGELAFNGCTGLKNAGLSGSGRDIEFGWTQTIPANAFSGCTYLAEAALPDSLTAIGSTAFANCALTEVTFPAGVTDIGSGAYDGCASLAVVRIPKNTVGIASSTFRGCTGLTDVYYGGYEEEAAHNKSAGWSTVENDPLFSAVWHYAMKPEEGWALCGPELFYRYDAESGTLSIKGSGPMWDFKLIGTTPTHPWVDYNSDIVSVSFEPGVTHIGAYAFYVCKGLTSVTVPEGVTSVGDHAFHYCNTMTGAVLPASLTSIGAGAFSYCEKLLDCAIPAGVTEIGAGAFANCYVLQSLVIPEGIEKIEKGSFGDCRSLTEVTIPDRVTVIGEGAFSDCRSMEKLVFGRQVASIDRFAFTGCSSMTSVTFPASLEQIGEVAFASCSSLTAIRFEGSAPEFDYRDPFYAVTATAYYPANDPSWTESVMKDYGGHITWVPYGETIDGLPIDEEHFPDEAFRDYVAEEFDGDGNGFLNDEEIAAVTEIDVSMLGITSLHGIMFFPELTALFCLDNELTELDLTHNPKLEMLDCSFNGLTALDVTRNPALTSIDCSENAIAALDVTRNPLLEGLFCYSNEIAALDLSGNPQLQVLDCSMNALTVLDLSANPGLVMLECYGNSMAELDLSPCQTLVDIVTNGKYEQKPTFDSYTASSGNFVHVDPMTKLITEASGEGFTITITDYTKGAAQTSLDLTAQYSGSVTFTVTSTGDQAVLVAIKNGDDYTALKCVTADGEHCFTLSVNEDTALVFALKGDADLNGKVTSTDGTMVKRAAMGTYSFDTQLKAMVSDADGDGRILSREGTMISRAAMGTYALPW